MYTSSPGTGAAYATSALLMPELKRELGRPELRKKLKRKVRINVFVTDTEDEKVARDAEKSERSVPDYIRDRLGEG